ncbi:hypothetical protein [Paractinoplanes ferrugineus]|uniref:hypothetical protein n=1 Tax=Paractinoplanes ferrugineus TaxID=113564 RepID=UPI0019451913|nr:hypothetical protein [Actinoplanes ferrugineus]
MHRDDVGLDDEELTAGVGPDARRAGFQSQRTSGNPSGPPPAAPSPRMPSRRGGRRVRFTGGRLRHHDAALPTVRWSLPAPLGIRGVIADLLSPDPSAPTAVDERGRSAQLFVVGARVRSGDTERRLTGAGRDVYAISGPLAVEAVDRILTGRTRARAGSCPPVRSSTPRTSSPPCPRT